MVSFLLGLTFQWRESIHFLASTLQYPDFPRPENRRMAGVDGMRYLSFERDSELTVYTRYPTQKLTRAQALKGMTLDPAFASFSENEVGSLEVGKKADFVVLDRDIMDEEREYGEILEAKVVRTVIDGAVAFGEGL